MTTRIGYLGASLILLGGVAGCALEPVTPEQPGVARGLEVSTAPVRVPPGGQARLVLSIAFDDDVRIPVTIVFRDVEGRVVDRREGVLAQGEPVIEPLGRQGFVSRRVALSPVASAEGLLLQNQVSFEPVESDGSCPVHLSLEVSGPDDSDTYLCPGIDPCASPSGDGTQGAGYGSDIFPACATQPAG